MRHRFHAARASAVLLLLIVCLNQPAAAAGPTRLDADTPATTAEGNRFVAPAEWTLRQDGHAVWLDAPEGDRVALIDIRAASADDAVAQAWKIYAPKATPRIKVATDRPPSDGWEQIRYYTYETPTDAHRLIAARAFRRDDVWTVAIGDISLALVDKRGAQFALIFDKLLPRDHARESFAGRHAHKLSGERTALLEAFVHSAMKQLDIPGVAVGLVQDGRVVLQRGFGVREHGKPEAVDDKTLFLVASNTKPLTTLMLAKLVDEGKFDWNTPVIEVMPTFKLGDAETTRRVQIKHLICACTGLPRRDSEWLMQFEGVSAADAVHALADMQPTSAFGTLYQYSNQLAAAGGYVGGYAAYPRDELGHAFDRAMQTRVFDPLGMRTTTFDFRLALRGNHASAHAMDMSGQVAVVNMGINRAIVPVRPAGGAWSNVEDLLRYVRMELSRGELADGKRFLPESTLLARRARQVGLGAGSYGMGLIVHETWGTPVVHHGGSMIGYKSDVLWLPEHNVGAVILTNSDSGQLLLNPFQRRLIEVLFDGKPEAEPALVAAATRARAAAALARQRIQTPLPREIAEALATHYRHASVGDIAVQRRGNAIVFDFGEWQSEVGALRSERGSVAIKTVSPGVVDDDGMTFVLDASTRELVMRAGQNEYRFRAVN